MSTNINDIFMGSMKEATASILKPLIEFVIDNIDELPSDDEERVTYVLKKVGISKSAAAKKPAISGALTKGDSKSKAKSKTKKDDGCLWLVAKEENVTDDDGKSFISEMELGEDLCCFQTNRDPNKNLVCGAPADFTNSKDGVEFYFFRCKKHKKNIGISEKTFKGESSTKSVGKARVNGSNSVKKKTSGLGTPKGKQAPKRKKEEESESDESGSGSSSSGSDDDEDQGSEKFQKVKLVPNKDITKLLGEDYYIANEINSLAYTKSSKDDKPDVTVYGRFKKVVTATSKITQEMLDTLEKPTTKDTKYLKDHAIVFKYNGHKKSKKSSEDDDDDDDEEQPAKKSTGPKDGKKKSSKDEDDDDDDDDEEQPAKKSTGPKDGKKKPVKDEDDDEEDEDEKPKKPSKKPSGESSSTDENPKKPSKEDEDDEDD